jgi:hypothetical protein
VFLSARFSAYRAGLAEVFHHFIGNAHPAHRCVDLDVSRTLPEQSPSTHAGQRHAGDARRISPVQESVEPNPMRFLTLSLLSKSILSCVARIYHLILILGGYLARPRARMEHPA